MFRLKKSIKTWIIRFKLKCMRSLFLGKNVQIIGINNISFGRNVFISDGSWINLNNRDNQKHLYIGNNSFIGRNNFFTVGDEIVLDDYFFSSVNCKIIGASHEKDPFVPYSASPTTTNKYIKIGTNVFLGAGVSIIGNVSIGFGSIIGADSVVISDIPPLSIAVGNPAKVIKRFNIKLNEWTTNLCEAEESMISETEYKKMIKNEDLTYQRFCYAYKGVDYL